MKNKKILIGGASGFWGDAARSTPQLLASGKLDYLVYDYLAEITMSIMARARAKDASKGYALDFVSVAMQQNLQQIAKQKVKVISNAGGVNPRACAEALRALISSQGLNLTVACIEGDDLIDQCEHLSAANLDEMFSGGAFPAAESLQSINAYLGAFPIAEALGLGADIVITGRCVDSAVTLGACINEFGWQADDLDKLAMGSLAGHILECGPQATGGNYTDWHLVADRLHEIGYPIVEITPDGQFICTKPDETGGLVEIGTVAEQMLYEIGDPQAYVLPDVICDFSQVTLQDVGKNRVLLSGAKGRSAPSDYKVCATYVDGFRGGTFLNFYGLDADKKARALSDAVFAGARATLAQMGLDDFTETSVEVIGAESQYGEARQLQGSREVAMKIAAKHPQAAGISVMLRECVGLGLATPPGLCGFQGSRPKPSPVVRLYSFLWPKNKVPIQIDYQAQKLVCTLPQSSESEAVIVRPVVPQADFESNNIMEVRLVELAWARSGDKGDKANVGVIARRPEYFPYIVAALSVDLVAQRFAHFLSDAKVEKSVERFIMPGSSALNFVLHAVLGGGGVASIRNDAQAKGYSQLLLEVPVRIPKSFLSDTVDFKPIEE